MGGLKSQRGSRPPFSRGEGRKLDWQTLWAVARYDLRLSEEEFWRLIPVQFDALYRRHLEERRWANYRAGIIASTIANIFCKLSKPIEPLDFFESKKYEQTPEDHLKIIELLNVGFGGKDLRKKKHGR